LKNWEGDVHVALVVNKQHTMPNTLTNGNFKNLSLK